MNNPYNQRNLQHNNLLSGYHNFQQNNIPFKNNNLLFNAPQFHKSQTNDMYQHMNRLKQAHELKRLEKINDIERVIDKSVIHDSVIKPMKEIKEDRNLLMQKYNNLQNNFIPELERNWRNRTNQPYKNVLKDDDYKKMNLVKKTTFVTEKDLIVHTITDADKIGLMKDLAELNSLLEKHNGELKVLYSLSNESKNKKIFEYNHKEKYRVKYNPKDYTDLKSDKIEFIKNEQMKLEKDKKRMEDIIESLLSKGLLSGDNIPETDTTDESVDIDTLEKELKAELGDDYYKLEKEAIEQLQSSNSNQSKNPTITTPKIGVVTDNVRDKYKNRQKTK